MTDEAFFLPLDGGGFRATEHTRGPWDPDFQHAGPPAALLTRALEREPASWSFNVARITVDILGPVPVTDLAVRSRVLRPGRSVELVEAELEAAGRTAMRAQAWRVRATDAELPPLPAVHDEGLDPVPQLPDAEVQLPPGWTGGYLNAMEWRQAAGDWGAQGPATMWGRMRVPLVAGEGPTGLQRLMTVADSGNGVSNVLPVGEWFFINTELTVHLQAVPTGEWICLDARTQLDRRGFGLAASRLFDRERLVARGAQALYVGPR